ENGILHASARDEATGNEAKTVIINKGRLGKEAIERMILEAEMYKKEDELQIGMISAKNSLESYSFEMKSTVEDRKLKDKITEADKKIILDKCNDVIKWLDNNQVFY